jgi:hypothetical protein
LTFLEIYRSLETNAATSRRFSNQRPAGGAANRRLAGCAGIGRWEANNMQPEAMRVHAKATDRPDFAQILARVRSLRPQIASRALAAEKAKRVRSLRKSGSNLAAPAAAPGGAEHWPFALVG